MKFFFKKKKKISSEAKNYLHDFIFMFYCFLFRGISKAT
jgi:hypothetical protein